RRAEAEMGAWVVAAQVTITGIDPALPAAFTRHDGDLGAVGVAPQPRVDGADRQPVALFWSHIAIEPGRPGNRRHEQVEGAVIIDIAARQPTGDIRGSAQRTVVERDI